MTLRWCGESIGRRRLDGTSGRNANKLEDQLNFGRIHLYWVGSGHMVDYLIHQIDECCWIKDAWPVSCIGMAGRAFDSTDCGQNIDVYSMEYTFADGTKAFCGFRRMKSTRSDFATYIHGTKCAAQFSGDVHAATVHMFRDQRIGETTSPGHRPRTRTARGNTNGTISSTVFARTSRTTSASGPYIRT